jgi:hypothetical protein
MKRTIRIEIRFDDGCEQGDSPSREAKQAVIAAKAAAKAAAEAALRSARMNVTETSSTSTIDDPR